MFRLLLLDIDGTLRPYDRPEIPAENVEAIRALQRFGVKVAIATGRSRAGVPEAVMNGIRPDYWICSAGAQILDREDRELYGCRMPQETVEKICAFCRERDFPLILNYPEGCYIHLGYDSYCSRQDVPSDKKYAIHDPDDSRRRKDQPYSCFAWMPQAREEEFHREFPDSGVSFYFYRGKFCDVMQTSVTKASGLDRLLELTGIALSESVFIGDGENDISLLRQAGLSWCMGDGAPAAKAAADRIGPASGSLGVAKICRELWPQAFDTII